jgi:hypothetical protein
MWGDFRTPPWNEKTPSDLAKPLIQIGQPHFKRVENGPKQAVFLRFCDGITPF